MLPLLLDALNSPLVHTTRSRLLACWLMAFLIGISFSLLGLSTSDSWLRGGPTIYLPAKGKVREEECATGYREYEEKRHSLPFFLHSRSGRHSVKQHGMKTIMCKTIHFRRKALQVSTRSAPIGTTGKRTATSILAAMTLSLSLSLWSRN